VPFAGKAPKTFTAHNFVPAFVWNPYLPHIIRKVKIDFGGRPGYFAKAGDSSCSALKLKNFYFRIHC
jgi:hypothetical protein